MKRSIILIGIMVATMASLNTIQAQRRGGDGNIGASSANGSQARNGSNNEGKGNSRAASSNRQSAVPTNNGNNKSDVRAASNNRMQENNRVVKVKQKEMRQFPSSKATVVTRHDERFGPANNYQRVSHNGVDYAFRDGRYYLYRGGQYVVTTPPRGIRVAIIPAGFLTIMVRNLAYYYYGGAYYRLDVAQNTYEVVDPPMGAIVPELPQYDVNAVVVNGKTYLEYDGILYKSVVTDEGVQYKVMGTLSDVTR